MSIAPRISYYCDTIVVPIIYTMIVALLLYLYIIYSMIVALLLYLYIMHNMIVTLLLYSVYYAQYDCCIYIKGTMIWRYCCISTL